MVKSTPIQSLKFVKLQKANILSLAVTFLFSFHFSPMDGSLNYQVAWPYHSDVEWRIRAKHVPYLCSFNVNANCFFLPKET